MKFFEKCFLRSLLKFSKFLHEYRFEDFSEQEEKVYQKNLERLRNLFGVEKSPISLDVIDTSVLTTYQRELLEEFLQNSASIKVRYREMVWFIWSNSRCKFSSVEREVICYMLQTLGSSSEEYARVNQLQIENSSQDKDCFEIEKRRNLKREKFQDKLMQLEIEKLNEFAANYIHDTCCILRRCSSDNPASVMERKKYFGSDNKEFHHFITSSLHPCSNRPNTQLTNVYDL
ncbi:hypothetical protein PDQ79_32325 [Bacillus cereus]|nr:hypothetical protein [Bacillus cereus]